MHPTNSKALYEHSRYTPCQDIFQAVCDELGRYYEQKGFKYSRSRPKISYRENLLKLEISFWSSRSNTPGDWVCLEILPSFYSNQLSKNSDVKGFLFGHTGLFYHKFSDDPKQIKLKHIFGEESERRDEYSTESLIIDSNVCNIYGLDEYKFQKITEFINDKILVWLYKLKTEQGILELVSNPSQRRIWALNKEHGNSEFVPYVKLNFPNVDIENMLCQ